MAEAPPSLAKSHIRPCPKAEFVMAKQRIGSPPGICYDSGEHLL